TLSEDGAAAEHWGMRLLRPASEDEMVAVFLTAEAASERYGPQIRQILARLAAPASSAISAHCSQASWQPVPVGIAIDGHRSQVAGLREDDLQLVGRVLVVDSDNL